MRYGRPLASVTLAAASLVLGIGLATQSFALAEDINVRYRGMVDLDYFECQDVARSGFIRRVCYDGANEYMLISLKGKFYHYCGIDSATVERLLSSSSKGQYFNAMIRGRFDCRLIGQLEYN